MGQFTDVMALGCIIITMVALVVEHIIEDRQDKQRDEEEEQN